MAVQVDQALLDRYLAALLERAGRSASHLDDVHAELADLVARAALGDPRIHDDMRASCGNIIWLTDHTQGH